ncbi:MAG: PilN domain-containing protein [Pseudoxanthomonas suwonensis]|nr:PilN domain-containing protein [Pseudoxanthomonas suwonensis]
MALRWWWRALAAWVPRRWRPVLGMDRRRLLLQHDAQDVVLHLEQGTELGELARLPGDALRHGVDDILGGALRGELRDLPRWWLLPAAHGLRRRLDMPVAAAPHLREAAGFEIERQTPFAADDVHYDARVLGPATRADMLQVELAVVPRERVAPLLDALPGVAGVDLAGGDGRPLGLNLLPAGARVRQRDPLRAAHWLLAGMALLLTIGWMWQVLDNRRAAADRLEQDVALLAERARGASVQRARLVGLVEGQAFLDASRQARPTNLQIIEELSRRLPDGTTLERFAVEGERLSMTGQSTQAASLVAQMEGSALWRSPALSGALQADARTRRDRFTLVAEVAAAPAAATAAGATTPAAAGDGVNDGAPDGR